MFGVIHFRKIDMTDEIFVINIGEYVWHNNQKEIEYEGATGKTVYCLDD